MKKFAKVIAKDMKKKAFTEKAEQAMDVLENKYNAELFEAWDNENKPLEEIVKGLLKEENIILSPEELNDVIDYINISFM
jgi:hypothetical protein